MKLIPHVIPAPPSTPALRLVCVPPWHGHRRPFNLPPAKTDDDARLLWLAWKYRPLVVRRVNQWVDCFPQRVTRAELESVAVNALWLARQWAIQRGETPGPWLFRKFVTFELAHYMQESGVLVGRAKLEMHTLGDKYRPRRPSPDKREWTTDPDHVAARDVADWSRGVLTRDEYTILMNRLAGTDNGTPTERTRAHRALNKLRRLAS